MDINDSSTALVIVPLYPYQITLIYETIIIAHNLGTTEFVQDILRQPNPNMNLPYDCVDPEEHKIEFSSY